MSEKDKAIGLPAPIEEWTPPPPGVPSPKKAKTGDGIIPKLDPKRLPKTSKQERI
jgi:hypothetical protein